MQYAVVTPALKSVALGGVLLAIGLFHARTADHRACHRLVLHTEHRPGALYLTAWRHGDVRVAFDGPRLVALTFKTRASVSDGCRWLGTERLLPLDAHRYAYDYAETILDCDPGAVPLYKTPRTGIVTVDD